MKKILASLFTISILTVSNAAFAAIGYVDYSYISKNYPLAQKYTQTLKTKNAAIVTYAKQKYDTLSLSVYQQNLRAVAFYHRVGFSILSEGVDEDTGEKEYTMCWGKL